MIEDKVKFYNQKNNARLNIKAVFFDMDGVLFDSMPAHAEAWIYALGQFNVPFTPQEVYLNEGRTGASTIDEVFQKKYNRAATDEEKQNIYRIKSEKFDELNHFVPVEGVKDLLQKVKESGLNTYIVTGSGQESLFDKINSHISGIFQREKMITAFDVKIGKPNPEPYLKALEKSKLLPHEAIVVENAPLGIQSAKAAGIFTIAVNTGILSNAILESAGADIVYSNMHEFTRHWENLMMCGR